MVVYGDTPEYIARLGLTPLARRLRAARERERQQLYQMASLLATIANAPHYKPKRPVTAEDLTRQRGRGVDREAFDTRQRAYYRRRVDRLMKMDLYAVEQHLQSRRGQEARLIAEAIEERRAEATGADRPLLYKMHRTLMDHMQS